MGSTLLAPFELQVERALDNLLAVVAAAGGSPATVARVGVYIVGASNWALFNGVYARRFGAHRPACTVVPVPALHHGYLVEILAIALRVVKPDGPP